MIFDEVIQFFKLLVIKRSCLMVRRYISVCASFWQVRISAKSDGQASRGLSWYHATCFLESSPSTLPDSLSGWQNLSPSDQDSLRAAAKGKAPSAETGTSSPLLHCVRLMLNCVIYFFPLEP